MDTEETRLRVLMFPWLGYGHLSPYLELAKKLSRRNFYIYFCSTPINLNSIKNRLSDHDLYSIELVELHLPSLPDLPPHYHTTNGLPPHLMPTLTRALEMARPNFANILNTLTPDLILFDHCGAWVPELAMSSYHIPSVHFEIYGAASSSFLYSAFNNAGGVAFPSSTICLRGPEMEQMIQLCLCFEQENPVFTCFERSHDIMLIKTCRDVDGKYIDYLSLLIKKKIVPVGLLTQVDAAARPDHKEEEYTEIWQWLSKKEKSSTVFVSFGSEYILSKKEMDELAYGLELSNVNFIWVIRFQMGEIISVEEALPEGFVERVGERGMIVKGWAPQAKILGHSSIGGFVSHCGWSSVTESMSCGVPIIAIPKQIDQPLNAKLVVELGVGLEVMKDENLEFEREEVARVIKDVVSSEGSTGEDIRKKARELSEKLRMKGEEEMDDVVEELKKLCKNNSGK